MNSTTTVFDNCYFKEVLDIWIATTAVPLATVKTSSTGKIFHWLKIIRTFTFQTLKRIIADVNACA